MGYAFTINGGQPEIDGFRFTGPNNYGIVAVGQGGGPITAGIILRNNQFISCDANAFNDYSLVEGYGNISFDIKHCLFYGNGQGYIIGVQGTGLIENCTFYGNNNSDNDYFGLFETSGGTTIIRNSIIRNNQSNNLSGNYIIEYSNIDFTKFW